MKPIKVKGAPAKKGQCPVRPPLDGSQGNPMQVCTFPAQHGPHSWELHILSSAGVSPEPQAGWQPEICICAAIRLDDGELFRGHRHDDALRVAGGAGVERPRIHAAEQGFVTSRNRFVSREEGCALQIAAGIPCAQTGKPLRPGILFSEDLYTRSTKGQMLAPVSPADAGSALPETKEKDLTRVDGSTSIAAERATASKERR